MNDRRRDRNYDIDGENNDIDNGDDNDDINLHDNGDNTKNNRII